MSVTKVLVFAASLRSGSFNRLLTDLARRRLQELGASVTRLDLAQYPMPLYDANLEAAEGVPAAALSLHGQLRTHDGVFIASPEYNASMPPLLVNLLAWVSRVTIDGGMAAAFGRPVFAIGSASLGSFGGYRGLVALRQVLELQFLARVLPAMVAVPAAHEAFDEAGELRSQRASELLGRIAAELVAAASGR